MFPGDDEMDVPIRFPSDVDVITEEVRRFRALSDAERVRTLGELFHAYHFLMGRAPRPEVLARMAREDEARGRAAIQEFVIRHG
jgi:hypothetical protein